MMPSGGNTLWGAKTQIRPAVCGSVGYVNVPSSSTWLSACPRLDHAPIHGAAAPTCPLTRQRVEAPTRETDLPRRPRRTAKASDDDREEQKDRVALDDAPAVGSEDDVSLRPLARALLALAEQLQREGNE